MVWAQWLLGSSFLISPSFRCTYSPHTGLFKKSDVRTAETVIPYHGSHLGSWLKGVFSPPYSSLSVSPVF